MSPGDKTEPLVFSGSNGVLLLGECIVSSARLKGKVGCQCHVDRSGGTRTDILAAKCTYRWQKCPRVKMILRFVYNDRQRLGVSLVLFMGLVLILVWFLWYEVKPSFRHSGAQPRREQCG